MKTLIQLSAEPSLIPMQTAWYLADLGENPKLGINK